MKIRPGHMAALALSALILLSSCGRRKDEAEVIPRDDLARIYAEMLLTDQWIVNTPNVRTIADTSLVYEPILEKYGYGSDDYRKSVDVYMDDPERFARILRETGEILNRRLDELKIKKERLEHLEKLRKEAEKYRPDIDWDTLFSFTADSLTVAYPDSLVSEMDSTGIYRLQTVARKDTVYEGVRMVLPQEQEDTVTVEKADTLASELVIERVDTILRKGASRGLRLMTEGINTDHGI